MLSSIQYLMPLMPVAAVVSRTRADFFATLLTNATLISLEIAAFEFRKAPSAYFISGFSFCVH